MPDVETDTVSLSIDDDVATVTVSRPDRLNALTPEAMAGIDDCLDAAREAEVGALLVTGAGEKAFAAGADIDHMREMTTPEALAYSELGHDVCRRIERFPVPAIAAVNGYAFGGGCELALACDLRVASERAVLGQTEIDLGVVPGWGGTQRLPRLVGDAVARRMILFGERLDATDALEHGLVGEVVAHDELDGHAAGLAGELAEKPRHALRAAKDALDVARTADLETGLRYEQRAWSGLFGTHDQREGMVAFVEDREPEFE